MRSPESSMAPEAEGERGDLAPAPQGDVAPLSPSRWRWVDAWEWYARLPPAPAFVLPMALYFVPAALAALLIPDALAKVWSVATLAPFALDVAILTGLALQLRGWLVLSTVLWIQLLFLVWFVRNLHLLRRWRRFDAFLLKQEIGAQRLYARRAWLRKFHFAGVATIVFLPFGTGVIAGIFLGKITGMGDRRVVGAVYLGTVLWAALLTWLGGALVDWLRNSFDWPL